MLQHRFPVLSRLQMPSGDDPHFCPPSSSISVIDLNPLFDLPHSISPGSSLPSEGGPCKKRKIDRACDFCRRRKTKCDGPSKANNVCSNCTQNYNRCTYVEGSRPRGPPKAYVTDLEDRLERMEAWLKRLRPEEDFSEQLGPPVLRDSWKYDSPCTAPKQNPDSIGSQRIAQNSSPRGIRVSPQSNKHYFSQSANFFRSYPTSGVSKDETSQSDSSDDEEYAETSLIRGLKHLTLRGLEPIINDVGPGIQSPEKERDSQLRFHGKSSSFYLVGPTRELKKQHLNAVEGSTGLSLPAMKPPPFPREFFWKSPPWETVREGIHLNNPSLFRSLTESFPPPDLAKLLIDLYFDNINLMFPILNRQIFDQQFEEGLQYRDAYFAAVCLAVFSVGSRWCNDTRVLRAPNSVGGPSNSHFGAKSLSWGQAGWSYCVPVLDFFQQRGSVFYPPCLFEMQLHCLLAMYFRVQGFSASWLLTTVGLRKAHDVGIHRRKIYKATPTAEDELWKRSCWILIGLGRLTAANFGRSCASRDEDIDVEMPIEVDDEYWVSDIPGMAFRQPQETPSIITAFNLWIKLTQIVAFAIRTIYAVNKTKVIPPGLGKQQWKQQVVRQLNAAMSDWVDSVPEHLKWSARMDNPVFANQSAILYLTYYTTQILIYKPFIPSCKLDKASSFPKTSTAHTDFPFPALAICINASKACLAILKVQLDAGMTDIPTVVSTSQCCSAILAAHIWRLKTQEIRDRSEALEDTKPVPGQTIPEIMHDVNQFIEILGNTTARYPLARNVIIALVKALPADMKNSGEEELLPDIARVRGQSAVDYRMAHQVDYVSSSFAANPMEFTTEQPDPHIRNGHYTHYSRTSFQPGDNATTTRLGSMTTPTSWPSRGRGNEFSFETNHQIPWTYHDVSSGIHRQETRCDARYVMPISQSKRRSTVVQMFNPESNESAVKREALDDHSIIQQLPRLRHSIFGPSHLEAFSQTPDVDNGWYIKHPGQLDWSVQSNDRATYTALE